MPRYNSTATFFGRVLGSINSIGMVVSLRRLAPWLDRLLPRLLRLQTLEPRSVNSCNVVNGIPASIASTPSSILVYASGQMASTLAFIQDIIQAIVGKACNSTLVNAFSYLGHLTSQSIGKSICESLIVVKCMASLDWLLRQVLRFEISWFGISLHSQYGQSALSVRSDRLLRHLPTFKSAFEPWFMKHPAAF